MKNISLYNVLLFITSKIIEEDIEGNGTFIERRNYFGP